MTYRANVKVPRQLPPLASEAASNLKVRDSPGCVFCHGDGYEVRGELGGLRLKSCGCWQSQEFARDTERHDANSAALHEADGMVAVIDLALLLRIAEGLAAI